MSIPRIKYVFATDKVKLWLSPSARQHQNPCSRPPPVCQDLSMCNGWPVIKTIVKLQTRMKENLKHTSGNSLSLSGPQNKDIGAEDIGITNQAY